MKIGLLTFHDTTNFGSFLQTYGLFKALINLGFDCEVIDYKCNAIAARELPRKKPENYSIRGIAKFLLIDKMIAKKYHAFQKTQHETLKLSREYTLENIADAQTEYDAILTGSDILWNLNITDADMTYFLDFVKDNNKKYAFSTSIGETWNEEEKKKIEPYLKTFRKIALREKDSVDWITDLYPGQVYSVCDPTMLLECSEWERFIPDHLKMSGEYVLVYFYNDDLLRDAKEFARKNNCKVAVINYGLPIRGVKNIHPYQTGEFLSLIRHSKAVFTSSYHGMLFSIYFKIPFLCYARQNGNNVRFKTVLEKLGLEKNFITTKFQDTEINIDYEKVSVEINKWRQESLNILKGYWDNSIN